MKKGLLFIPAALFLVTANAQQGGESVPSASKPDDKLLLEPVDLSAKPAAPFASKARSPIATSAPITVVNMGNAGNAYTCAFSPKTYCWYDPDINAMTFSHRGDPAVGGYANNGFLLYDVSKDGGATWTSNAGPLFAANLPYSPARYPQSAIYNPAGNAVADSAWIIYYGPTLNGTNGAAGSWGGTAWGLHQLNGLSAPKQHEDSSVSPYFHEVPPGHHGILNGGPSFNLDRSRMWDGTRYNYTNNLNLSKLTFNPSTRDVDLTRTSFTHNVSIDNLGYTNDPVETDIAFGPDGLTGWISIIGHTSFALEPDSVYYLTFYKTTDGGATWGSAIDVVLSSLPGIGDSLRYADGSPAPWAKYSTAFEHDLAVDMNGNPHVIVAIGGGEANAWTIQNPAGRWAIFDVNSTDGGTNWAADYIASPQMFRATFGQASNTIPEDSRPQIAMTKDGTKLFYVWFDTDTLTFDISSGNMFPDANVRGRNLVSGGWTQRFPHPYGYPDAYNFTAGSAADGLVTFGNVSYYVKDDGTNYCVPIVFQQIIDPADMLAPTTFKYIEGICFTDADFIVVGVDEKENSLFSVNGNHPNPFSGQTKISFRLNVASDIRLTVTNTLGQVVRQENLGHHSAGEHSRTLDMRNAEAGIYFYSIEAGDLRVTQKMIVQ